MREVNLLDTYPGAKRPIAERETAVPRQREIAKRFGKEYFDGDRTQGYGGYRYDGRWLPIAKRMRDFYGLQPNDRILDVGCAKGFLLHDLVQEIPGVRVVGLDISRYALETAMDSVKPYLVQGSAVALPFSDGAFELVVSINTVHNLELDGCKQAIREIERVSRAHKYLQVDSWLDEEQRRNFERWQLTAQTYFAPEGWRRLFSEVGYTGDYSWTITE
jgi:cyclopropane fatty-acyl-phospholipid synthase-like methyltransferase